MIIMKGEMDHFVPVTRLKKKGQDELIYEWTNFRYAEGVLNQRKSDHLVLDPFEVKDKWFKIILPSLQLLLTDKVPKKKLKKAKETLEKLGLQDDEVVIRYRQQWFDQYRQRNLTLEGLKHVAPLIAAAVEQDLAIGKDWRV